MHPQYGALYSALEQLARDRRDDLLASARPRGRRPRARRAGRPLRRRLPQAIRLRPATAPGLDRNLWDT